MSNAKVEDIHPNDFISWAEFENHQTTDPLDAYGWFHVRIGTAYGTGTNDFQVCVATPRACGRAKQHGSTPGVVVDQFRADNIRMAIYDRVESISGPGWYQILAQLRKFMLWEYEGMFGE